MTTRIKQFKRKIAEFCKSINVPIYHNESSQETGSYAVWYELGIARLLSNDGTVERCPTVSVQLWTDDEYSPIFEKIEEFFDECDYPYDLQTFADYDRELKYYHYGWVVDIL